MRDFSPPDDARKRIQSAFDPEFLSSAGHRLAELLHSHLAFVQAGNGPVLNWKDPAENTRTAAAELHNQSPTLERFTELVQQILGAGQNLHHPRYIGHQVPASVPLAGWFDAVGSVTNQVMAIYEMGPWATSVERAMVNAIGERIGFIPGEFDGLVTHGGSLANLTGLLTARNVTLGDAWENGVQAGDRGPVLVCHAHAHYSLARTAGLLGIGTKNMIRAELDNLGRIDVPQLDRSLTQLRTQGRPIVAVCACACATPIGAFDRLNELADVCEQHKVWLHVDAAHGGAACFSERYAERVSGLERADSVVLDAHKMMFMPALCAFVFYRNREHRFEAFRQEAPYLFDPSVPGMADYDSGMKTVECTKRAATFGLWGTWCLFGPELFADMVDTTFDLGREFHAMLVDAPDFEPLHKPECNIVVFRHIPEWLRSRSLEAIGEFQLSLRRHLIESGKFYIVPAKPDGIGALRVTIINPLTTAEDLGALMATLREMAAEME